MKFLQEIVASRTGFNMWPGSLFSTIDNLQMRANGDCICLHLFKFVYIWFLLILIDFVCLYGWLTVCLYGWLFVCMVGWVLLA